MEDEKADVMGLLEVNNLDYRLPPSLSIATSRSLRTFPALTQVTTMGDTMIFVVSTGATYVDLKNSFIEFDVNFLPGTVNAAELSYNGVRLSPHTGYANALQKYTVLHSSGVELDRQNDATGEFVQTMQYYNQSHQRRLIQGSLYLHNEDSIPGAVFTDTSAAYDEAKAGVWWQTMVPPAPGPFPVVEKPTLFPTGTGIGAYTTTTNSGWIQKYNLPAYPILTPANTYSSFQEDVPLANNGAIIGVPPPPPPAHIVIPLAEIIPLFDNSNIAPSYLMAGLRIELTFYPKEYFFQQVMTQGTGGGGTVQQLWPPGSSVTFNNAQIAMETFTLSDAIARKLAQISAATGLEWAWDATHQTSQIVTTSSNSIQINRALSRANVVLVKTRTNSNVGNPVVDSFASDPWDLRGPIAIPANYNQDGTMISFQVQLGAQYIPAAPITRTPDFLHSALKSFAQFRRNDELGGVPLWLFRGISTYYGTPVAVIPDIVRAGLAISSVPLETSSTLQQSGSAISAQRTAVINMTWNNGRDAAFARRIDLFVPYTKVASLFLDSCVVRS